MKDGYAWSQLTPTLLFCGDTGQVANTARSLQIPILPASLPRSQAGAAWNRICAPASYCDKEDATGGHKESESFL